MRPEIRIRTGRERGSAGDYLSPQRRWRLTRDDFWGYLFILPQLVGLLAFIVYPAGFSLYLCFSEWDFMSAPQFIGLQNIQEVFSDDLFLRSLGNTFYLVAGIVPLTMAVSLLLALLTNRPLFGLGAYKAALFLPMITASIAVIVVWYWLYAPDFGLINIALEYLGIQGPGWLSSKAWAKPAITLMITWQRMGYFYLLFLAGLKSIPREYYEAAGIDGATRLQQFRHITLPLLSPTTFFILTTMLIGTFSIFSEPFFLARGGPAYATYTIVLYIYNLAFSFFKLGEAAVASWALFALLFAITYAQLRLSKRWVHYGD